MTALTARPTPRSVTAAALDSLVAEATAASFMTAYHESTVEFRREAGDYDSFTGVYAQEAAAASYATIADVYATAARDAFSILYDGSVVYDAFAIRTIHEAAARVDRHIDRLLRRNGRESNSVTVGPTGLVKYDYEYARYAATGRTITALESLVERLYAAGAAVVAARDKAGPIVTGLGQGSSHEADEAAYDALSPATSVFVILVTGDGGRDDEATEASRDPVAALSYIVQERRSAA